MPTPREPIYAGSSPNNRLANAMIEINERCLPHNSSYTYRVGAGGDIATFHEAMTWACNIPVTNGITITLELLDGDHVIGKPSTWKDPNTVYGIHGRTIRIYSDSGDPTLCKLSFPADDGGDVWPTVFVASHGAYFYFSKIGFDPSDNGYPYPTQVSLASAYYGSLVWLSSPAINGIYQVGKAAANSELVWRTLLTDTVSNIGGLFFQISENSYGWVYVQTGSLTLNTVGKAFVASNGCKMIIPSANMTLTSVTTPYETNGTVATLRQIDYDGSFITDESGALSFKA